MGKGRKGVYNWADLLLFGGTENSFQNWHMVNPRIGGAASTSNNRGVTKGKLLKVFIRGEDRPQDNTEA